MQEQTNSSRVIIKKDQDGNLLSISIDGIDYDMLADTVIAIPESALGSVRTSEFPKNIDIMLLDENGEALGDTNGIKPTYVNLTNDKTGVVRCEANLCGTCWDGIISYYAYSKALLHLFKLPKQVKVSHRGYLIKEIDNLNYGFDFTIEGATIGEILAIANNRIIKTLKPLSDIEDVTKRELKKIESPFPSTIL